MKVSVKVLKNTGWLASAQVTARVFSAIFIILLANHLLPASFGIYNSVMAFSYLFTVVVDWGLDELMIREVSREPKKASKYLCNVLFLRISLGLISLAVIFLVYQIIDSVTVIDTPLTILLVAVSILIFEKLSNTFSAQFQALERMELQALVTLIWKIIYLSMGISAIYLGYDLLKILLFLLISYIVQLFLSLLVYRTALPSFKITNSNLKIWKDLLSNSSPFALFVTVSVIYGHVIIVLLALFAGSYATGLYSASWKIIIFLGVVPYSFGRAIYPVFSRLYSSGRKILKRAYLESLRFLLILSLPLTLGLYVIAGDILNLIYSVEYQQTNQVFRTIIWVLPFLFMNGSLKMVLWSSERTVDSSKNLIAASSVLVVSGIALIHLYGVYGAAMAILFAEITHFLLNYHIVSGQLSPAPLSYVWKPYLSSMFMGLLLYLPTFFDLNISALWILPIAMVCYFLILYLLKGITRDDVSLIKEMLRRE
ncbi:MAG: flippase [Candidatus Saliniplasma sp.]